MDYAELAKRLREPLLYGDNTLLAINAKTMLEAADAIEALTSPPDEAQAMAPKAAAEYADERKRHSHAYEDFVSGWYSALNAAHRIRVKKEAKA